MLLRQTAEKRNTDRVASPLDSDMNFIRNDASKSSSVDVQSPVPPVNHDCPDCTDDVASGVTSSGWVAVSREGTLKGGVAVPRDGLTIYRCRSDDTLSSMSDWRSRDPQVTDRSRRYHALLHRPSLSSRQHQVLVEINRRGSVSREYAENVYSVSGGMATSNEYHRGAVGPHVVVI